jgi:hypothetical protein
VPERLTFVAEGNVPEAANQLHATEFKNASYSGHNANAFSDKELMATSDIAEKE